VTAPKIRETEFWLEEQEKF